MYVKDTIYFEDFYKQVFQNKPSNSISRHEIIKNKNDGIITDLDLSIISFLFRVRFATLEQLFEYLIVENLVFVNNEDNYEEEYQKCKNSIRARMDILIHSKIANKFMLSQIQDIPVKSDSLQIYCMDVGGRYLLNNYSSYDVNDWYNSVNLKSASNVSRDLMITNVYVQMLKDCGHNLKHFQLNPIRRFGTTTIVPSFEAIILKDGFPKYFIGEIIKQYDVPILFDEKCRKFEALLSSNSWRKFYQSDSEPMLLLFAENDDMLLDIVKIVNNSEISKYRLTTDNRINPLSTAFFKFDKENNKLIKTKASIFSNN